MIATFTSQPIVANVSTTGSVSVSVSSSPAVSATASGGLTQQSPPGASAISSAQDVRLSGLADGDVLRYSNSSWRNYPDRNLTDGGHF